MMMVLLMTLNLKKRLETLNKIVRSCTLGYKLFLNPKEIKTDLPVLYL